jgi:hypothetical protein
MVIGNTYSIPRKKSKRLLIIFILFAIPMFSESLVYGQSCYKQNTGYLLKEVEPNAPHFFNRYKYGQIGSSYYNFNIVDEKSLLNFFLDDSVNFDQTILLCDPAVVMFADSATSRDVRRFTRIKDILLLDDSEIYGIGGRKYFIRKIRYAYYDNTQVKVYIKGYNYYDWDDITSEDEAVLSEIYEVGQLYKRDYYQCYHHLVEILPTPPQISKHAWRKLYQLGEDRK